MSYREKNGQVILTMTQADYAALLVCLAEAGASDVDDPKHFRAHMALLNRLNEGNPDFPFYKVTEVA